MAQNHSSHSWRPIPQIRGKAIGLAVQSGKILVCEVLSDEELLKGGVHWAEGFSLESALKRP